MLTEYSVPRKPGRKPGRRTLQHLGTWAEQAALAPGRSAAARGAAARDRLAARSFSIPQETSRLPRGLL